MTPEKFIKIINEDLSKIAPEDKRMISFVVSTIKYYLKEDETLASSPLVIDFIEKMSSSLGIKLTIQSNQQEKPQVESKKEQQKAKENAVFFKNLLCQEDFGLDEIKTIEAFGQNYEKQRVSFESLGEVEKYLVYSIINGYIKEENKSLLDQDFFGSSLEKKEETIEISTIEKIKEFSSQTEQAGEMVFCVNIRGEEFSVIDFIDENVIRKIYSFTKTKKGFKALEIIQLIEESTP